MNQLYIDPQFEDYLCDCIENNFYLYDRENEAKTSENDALLLEKINQFLDKNKLKLVEDEVKTLRYITQYTGDDEIVLTNTKNFGLLMLGVSEVLLRLKISWKDVGFSKYIANYAEDWLLMPIKDEMTFKYTNFYHRGSGIPFILETVKTKMISPVRKQSQLELDLDSKLKALGTSARWTNNNWFTYDYHQLALIFAMEVFDFSSESLFPFLGKEEGGSAVHPPWNCIETVRLYLYWFNRGKSKRPVLGLMDEVVKIYEGSITGAETFFLKSIKASLAGEEIWKQYALAYKTIQSSLMTEIELSDLISTTLEHMLPRELIDTAIEFQADDFATASIIANLRNEGLLMTELDVKMYESSLTLTKALRGPIKIGVVKELQKEEEKLLRAKPLKVLQEIAKKLDEKELILPELLEDEELPTMEKYFKLKNELFFISTSFHYSGRIRIFKTFDVINYYQGQRKKALILDMFEGTYEKTYAFLESFSEPIDRNWPRIREWLEANDPLEKPIPIGAGPDDARIVKQIYANKQKNTAFILVSNDNQLSILINSLIKTRNKKTGDYSCLLVMSVGVYLEQARKNRMVREPGPFFNCVSGYEIKIPSEVSSLVFKMERKRSITFLYDFPNIERCSHSYAWGIGSLMKFNKGFLDKEMLSEVFSSKFHVRGMNELFERRELFSAQHRNTHISLYLKRPNDYFDVV